MPRRPLPPAPALRAEDWAQAALDVLAERGPGAVAVEPLARRLGVTKGSFYWHFRDRAALVAAALERWEAKATEAVIGALAAVADPRERLARLFREVADPDRGRLERGLVAAAAADRMVRAALQRVTARRADYLFECYAALGLPAEEARHRALLAHAAYVGLLHVLRDVPARSRSADAEAFLRHAVDTLVPGPRASTRRPARPRPARGR